MKKMELEKKIAWLSVGPLSADPRKQAAYRRRNAAIREIAGKLEARIAGKKGAEAARDRFAAMLDQLYPARPSKPYGTRRHRWEVASAEALAQKVGLRSDEHGRWERGDYVRVSGRSFVGPWESAAAPYWDLGGEGLGLVCVERTRTYAKSSKWRPSSVSTYFLVGKNEAGTYFSHPVHGNCRTVEDALDWIWGGKAGQIVQRQGDIALIQGNGGPKMPARLPRGHKVEGDYITHATHPDLPLPQKGQRIIVGRRAAERATSATRD